MECIGGFGKIEMFNKEKITEGRVDFSGYFELLHDEDHFPHYYLKYKEKVYTLYIGSNDFEIKGDTLIFHTFLDEFVEKAMKYKCPVCGTEYKYDEFDRHLSNIVVISAPHGSNYGGVFDGYDYEATMCGDCWDNISKNLPLNIHNGYGEEVMHMEMYGIEYEEYKNEDKNKTMIEITDVDIPGGELVERDSFLDEQVKENIIGRIFISQSDGFDLEAKRDVLSEINEVYEKNGADDKLDLYELYFYTKGGERHEVIYY